MLDIVLIQHNKTGLSLFEYRQEHTKISLEHSDIFSGFLSAIQNITHELDIGKVNLISTGGKKGHNCIIVPRDPINIVLLVDQEDSIKFWRETGNKIAQEFIKKYHKSFDPHNISQFKNFEFILKKIVDMHNYFTFLDKK